MTSVIDFQTLPANRACGLAKSQLQFRMTYAKGRAVVNIVRKSIDQCQVRSIRFAYPVRLAVDAFFN